VLAVKEKEFFSKYRAFRGFPAISCHTNVKIIQMPPIKTWEIRMSHNTTSESSLLVILAQNYTRRQGRQKALSRSAYIRERRAIKI